MMRTQNSERREKLRQMLETETVPDKIGLTRVPFSMKKLPSEQLRETIAAKSADIREKIQQWHELKSEIEQKIEAYFLAADDDFIKAGRAFGLIAETRAILTNLRNRLVDYMPRLGQVRGAMAAGYNTATQSFSPTALDTIKAAIESGYAVDGIILKLQERENQFNQLVSNTFAQHVTLPEFYTLSLGDFTETLRTMPLDAAQDAVGKAVKNCEQFLKESFPAYEQALAHAEQATRDACLKRIDSFWQDLRAQVWKQLHEIKPMPQSARMTTAPFQTAGAVPEQPGPAPSAPGQPVEDPAMPAAADKDTGRGLTGDYYEKPAERRSRLKLRTPS